uniref:RRM domain-containing protein n=1 Tax=Ascaris lumbricoides TaxID=6252 RepID=A0A9J2P6W5_ASCLU
MNNYQNYYRNGRYDRIDQDEVPESKHTVFIRGLPGHIKTDEINALPVALLNSLRRRFLLIAVTLCSFSFTILNTRRYLPPYRNVRGGKCIVTKMVQLFGSLCTTLKHLYSYTDIGRSRNLPLEGFAACYFRWFTLLFDRLLIHCKLILLRAVFFDSQRTLSRDFFEDHVGPCSFDFIKLSQDQLKLFVAVRFETRDAAKECMHKYKDGEVLGYPVELTWFRDIRRYVSYQQSQGLRPATVPRNRAGYANRNNYNTRNSYDRSSRNEYRDDDYDRGSKRTRTVSDDRRSGSKRSRSRSRSSSHSRSPRSASPRRSSRERSHTAESRRSGGSHAHSHSHSQASSPTPPPRERTASPPVAASPTPKRTVEGEGLGEGNEELTAFLQMIKTSSSSDATSYFVIIDKGNTPPLPPTPAPVTSIVTKRVSKENSPQKSQKSDQSQSASPVVERKSRKSKKEKRKRKRRSPSSSSTSGSFDGRSSGELSEGELRKKILKKREKALREENAEGKFSKWLNTMGGSLLPNGKANGKAALGKWEEKSPSEAPSRPDSSLLQNTTLKFGLEGSNGRVSTSSHTSRENVGGANVAAWNEDIPKQVVREPLPQLSSKKPISNSGPSPSLTSVHSVKPESNDMRPSPPPLPPRASKTSEALISDTQLNFSKKAIRDIAGIGTEMAKAEATSSSSLFSTDIDSLLGKRPPVAQPVNATLFDDLKSSQTSAFASVRGQQAQIPVRSILDDPDEPVQSSSGLRLSSFTRQMNAETERDRKLARLPPEMLSKFVAKKKQFEMTFKSDCETFGFVAKTLIQKDPALEERLRLALAEAVKDMEDAFTQKIDQLLDQLVMFASI